MHWSGPFFVLSIITICTLGMVFNTWIRARHGYPLENEWSGLSHRDDPSTTRQLELLSNENGAAKEQISRLEERIAVLERIATDPAVRTAHEIEALRHR